MVALGEGGSAAGGGAEVLGVLEQCRGHGLREQDEVGAPGGQGAAGHAVELSGEIVLHENEPAGVVDGAYAAGAVRAGAGEDDADGTIAGILG